MQMLWQEKANDDRISQITHPNIVHEFINSNPGLKDACDTYLPYLLAYAPQLGIRGFGGEYEGEIEEMYQLSLKKQEHLRAIKDSSGSGLIIDKLTPACHEMFALRHPNFGYYNAGNIACWFVQGDLNGPEVKFYEIIDYIAWILSKDSRWLPNNIREYLIQGFKEWNVWAWDRYNTGINSESQFEYKQFFGALARALYKANSFKVFKLNNNSLKDLQSRLDLSTRTLGLEETGAELASRFIERGFIENWFRERSNGRKRRIT